MKFIICTTGGGYCKDMNVVPRSYRCCDRIYHRKVQTFQPWSRCVHGQGREGLANRNYKIEIRLLTSKTRVRTGIGTEVTGAVLGSVYYGRSSPGDYHK